MAFHQHCTHCHRHSPATRVETSAVDDRQFSRPSPIAVHNHHCADPMSHYHRHNAPPPGQLPTFHYQTHPADNDSNSPSLYVHHHGPWPTSAPDTSRPGASMVSDSMGTYLHPGHHHSISAPPFDYNEFTASPSAYIHNHVMGVLTPDQSPHTVSLTVPEDTDYTSEPPRPGSPPVEEKREIVRRALKSSSPVQRPDGVRKKNAKFDIPAGRNVETIDGLIANARNEEELKTLKGQKRLLKNREAALQSRARKKAHTERLEEQINALEGRISQLQRQNTVLSTGLHNDPDLEHMHSLKASINTLQHENAMLRDQIQNPYPSQAATALHPPSYGHSVDDIANMNFDGGNFDFLQDEFCIESDHRAVKKEPRNDLATSMPVATQGTLLTLLMYGAHMASQTSQPGSSNAKLVTLSPDDCAAASNVLHAMFNNAGSMMQSSPSSSPEVTAIDIRQLAAANPQVVAGFKTLFDGSQ